MAAKSMDAVTAFDSLLQQIPQWQRQVTDLTTYTGKKNDEFRAEYARLVHQAKPKRLKTASICSIHTLDEQELDAAITATPLDTVAAAAAAGATVISPLEAGHRYILAQANKKRRAGTSVRSGAASGPLKPRNRNMVVIYYDAHVQEQFDLLVKAVGSSRNNLRKGKMSYTVSRGFPLPPLKRGLELNPHLPGADGLKTAVASRSTPKLSVVSGPSPATDGPVDATEAFCRTDKALEACQALCETAAHQFLRDGDCRAELETMLTHLSSIHQLAQQTYETVKAEDEAKTASDEEADDGFNALFSTPAPVFVRRPSHEPLNFSRKLTPSLMLQPERSTDLPRPVLMATQSAPPAALSAPASALAPASTPAALASAEIEVDDDSDQSTIDIDIGRYRIGNAARLRA